jgi:hypothetical protein
MAEKTVLRVFQSMYFGNDAGQVEQAGCVPYTATSRADCGKGSGFRSTPLRMLKTAVVTPIPRANASSASSVTNRDRMSVRRAPFKS